MVDILAHRRIADIGKMIRLDPRPIRLALDLDKITRYAHHPASLTRASGRRGQCAVGADVLRDERVRLDRGAAPMLCRADAVGAIFTPSASVTLPSKMAVHSADIVPALAVPRTSRRAGSPAYPLRIRRFAISS